MRQPLTRAEDELILQALHLFHNEGLTSTQVAQRIGKSQAAVCGIMKRVRDANGPDEVACACRRTENRDGGMPPRWWAQ